MLVTIHLLHPKVLERYIEAGYELDDNKKLIGVLESASDVNERAFWQQVESAKQPVKKEITKIIRIRKQGKEHFYYHESLTSKNYLGNRIHFYHTVGLYKDPHFNRVADAKTGKVRVTDIDSEEEVYELQWPQDWTQDMEDIISETVDLLVVTPARKYGGFSFPDFKDRTFDELVTLGKFGTLKPEQIEAVKKRTKQT